MALFGVVSDCLTMNPRNECMTSGPAWFISAFDGKRGYGRGQANSWKVSAANVGVGKIKDGQVLSMELNLDGGTLKFWVDGHLHGPGFTCIHFRGYWPRFRWATCVTQVGMSVRIVPTPTLDGV